MVRRRAGRSLRRPDSAPTAAVAAGYSTKYGPNAASEALALGGESQVRSSRTSSFWLREAGSRITRQRAFG